jgi:hypothetical protein
MVLDRVHVSPYRLCCKGQSIPCTGPSRYQAELQLYVGSCRLGGNSICLFVAGVLLWPPRRPPQTACVHFRDSYPDVSQFSLSAAVLGIYLYGLFSKCPPRPILQQAHVQMFYDEIYISVLLGYVYITVSFLLTKKSHFIYRIRVSEKRRCIWAKSWRKPS